MPRAVAESLARLDKREDKEFDMKKEETELPEEESKVILYTTDDGKAQVSLMSRDGRVWLNQKQMAELFAVSKPNISMLIAKIFAENELNDSVVKSYLTTAAGSFPAAPHGTPPCWRKSAHSPGKNVTFPPAFV